MIFAFEKLYDLLLRLRIASYTQVLQRQMSVTGGVIHLVDRTHPPTAEELLNPITVGN
jgi:hypothetical protein